MDKPLILVVDDEVDVANFISQSIKETERYNVITVYSGKDALRALDRNKIFFGLGGNRIMFVVLDIKMPGMDGLDVLEKIREDHGENIGVSMLTAWEDNEKWDRATSGFVVNYLKKPFKADELTKTLDDYFAGNEGKMVVDTFKRHIAKMAEFKKGA